MKITRFMALAAVTLLLFACEKEEVFMNGSLENATMKSKSAASGGNSYLVIANSNKLPNNLMNDLASANGTLTSAISQVGIAVVSSDDPEFVSKASKIKGVQSVVPNLTEQWLDPNEKSVSFVADNGNPPSIGDDEQFFGYLWGLDAIDAPEAWNEGYKGAGVRVAVLDGGFYLDQPDLAPNINLELSMNFVDDEVLQFIPTEEIGLFSHGSHVAGTIAAAANGIGIIGVAPEAELVLLKVLGDSGSGNFGDLIEAIIYAADNEADVINMSLSGAWLKRFGSGYAALTNAVNRATTYAYQKGTTVIAAAGNNGWDRDHFFGDLVVSPADGPNVISVSATAPYGWILDFSTNLDVPASYTNFGQSAIDFAAPGGDFDYPAFPIYLYDMILSSGGANGWYFAAGTSMASPHVAGVAALIISKNGGSMKPAQVEAALRASADDLGKPGNDDYYGAGRVNAHKAVTR
jgi:subtilisin family serine protease